MGKKFDDLQKSKIRFFGFEYDAKAFLISIGSAFGAYILLIALTLFGVNISWYGVLFGTGFLVALVLSGQLCKERNVDPEFPFTLIWFVFPLSILGARIYFLVFHGGIDSFADIFTFWQGGLAVYGGIIGGLIGLIIGCLWKKVSIIGMTDIAAPLLSLGQAFGRIGCIFGECCYGVEVANKALHWFPISIKVDGTYYFATNFYEAIFNFVLFIVLTILLRKIKIKGVNTCAYLVGYGLVRFILETFREEGQTLFIGNYPVSKLVSVGCVLVGVIGICALLIVNHNKENKEVQSEK